MLELFCTFIITFSPIFLYILICLLCYFKMNFILIFFYVIVFQFIISCILLSKNFFKETIFWKKNNFQIIHSLQAEIIKNISINKIEYFSNLSYTLEGSDLLSKECLTNFFISDIDICPITEIIVENKKSNKYINHTEIILDNNLYLYFSRDVKNGSLYQNINNYSNFFEILENKFNFSEFNLEEQLKEEEILKKLDDYKRFIDYSDIVCFTLILISIPLFIIIQIYYYSILYFFINLLIQISIFVLYILRYKKFIQLKIISRNIKIFFFFNIKKLVLVNISQINFSILIV